MVAHFLATKRQESAFLASLLLCLLILVSCSIAILLFEVSAGGNIATAQCDLVGCLDDDSVGYGDKYPISPEGRMVAVFLMAAESVRSVCCQVSKRRGS